MTAELTCLLQGHIASRHEAQLGEAQQLHFSKQTIQHTQQGSPSFPHTSH